MKKLKLFLVLAFLGVIIFWLFKDPESLASTISVIAGGLRHAAEQLLIFLRDLF